MGFIGCGIGIGEGITPSADELFLPSVAGGQVPSDAECRRTRNGGTHSSAPNEG